MSTWTAATASARQQTNSTTCTDRPANGNSTHKPASKNSTPYVTKTWIGRRHSRRQHSKTTKNTSTTKCHTASRDHARTTSNKDENLSSHCDNQERRNHKSNLQWGRTGDHNRKDPPGAVGDKHRGPRPRTNNRRHEAGDMLHERATSVHRSALQQPQQRAMKQSHQVTMGSSKEGQRSPSPDCCKRLHRRCQGQRRNLSLNTHLLHHETSPHSRTILQLDGKNRRHFNSISTC